MKVELISENNYDIFVLCYSSVIYSLSFYTPRENKRVRAKSWIANRFVMPKIKSLKSMWLKENFQGIPAVAQWKLIQLVSMRMRLQSLASFGGLRIQCHHELWYRSQTQLGSCNAVAVGRLAAAIPVWPLAWELPYAMDAALKKTKQNKTERVSLGLYEHSNHIFEIKKKVRFSYG